MQETPARELRGSHERVRLFPAATLQRLQSSQSAQREDSMPANKRRSEKRQQCGWMWTCFVRGLISTDPCFTEWMECSMYHRKQRETKGERPNAKTVLSDRDCLIQ